MPEPIARGQRFRGGDDIVQAMRGAWRCLVVLVAPAAFLGLACSREPVPASGTEGDGGPDAGSEAGSFDPRAYPSACSTSSDCVLAPLINQCTTCCETAPVRADAVTEDLEAVKEACRAGRGLRNCLMDCGRKHAECIRGLCAACTELACDDGVSIELLPVLEGGTWVVEATVDGALQRCTMEIGSVPGPSSTTCNGAEIKYLPTGAGPASARMAMFIPTTTAKLVSVRMTHNGVELTSKTFEPAYVAVPGPNGPDCEPKLCTVANATLR